MKHKSFVTNATNIKNIFCGIIIFLTIAAISHNTFKTFAYLYAPQLEIFYQITHLPDWKGGNLWSIAKHLIDGTPRPDLPMYAWANRQLAPRIIQLISGSELSYREATIAFIWLGILIQNFLLVILLLRSDNSILKTLSLVVCFNYLFVTFHDRTGLGWFYVWDILSVIIFTIFSYLVVTAQSLRYFVFLFFVALLNREDAIFIALFLVISSLELRLSRRLVKLIDCQRLIIGVVLILIGAIYTKYSRTYFAFTEAPNRFGNNLNSVVDGIYNLFVRNFSFVNDKFFFNAIDGFWLVVTVSVILIFYRDAPRYLKDLGLVYISFVLSIIMFGNHATNEIRLYLPLFPIFIFIISKVKLNQLKNQTTICVAEVPRL